MGLGVHVSTPAFVAVLSLWTAVALAASAVLIVRLERLGARFGFTEASLGLLAALAADAPEITSAVTALRHGQHDIGVGVVLGSNVFNLAALLGLSAIIAGRIAFHRNVVIIEGGVGIWVAILAVAVLLHLLPAAGALALAAVVFVPYVWLSAMSPKRRGDIRWMRRVSQSIMRGIADAESEVRPAEHELTADPQHSHRSGRDALLAAASIVVVVYASIQMEGGMATLGTRWHLSDAIVGAVILAAITSLPNAVAAIYLARRGRGAATLSEAMNSNTINAIAGFLIPAFIIGVGVTSAASTTVGWWYLGLTVVCLAIAYALRGITRYAGVIIIAAYAVFVARL